MNAVHPVPEPLTSRALDESAQRERGVGSGVRYSREKEEKKKSVVIEGFDELVKVLVTQNL